MENESKLTVTAAMKTPGIPNNIKNGISIAKIKLAPLSFYIGPVPIPYAAQSVDLVIGLDASAKIQFQTGFDSKNTIEASLIYTRGEGFKPQFTSDNKLEYTPFDLKIEGKVEPFLGIYWKADPYLLDAENSRLEAGPRVSFPIVGTLNTEEARLKMDFLVSLHMVAKLGFVNVSLVSYDENWKMYEKNIFDKSFDWDNEQNFSFIINGQSESEINVYDSFLLELRPANPVEGGFFTVWYHWAPEGIRWLPVSGGTNDGKYMNFITYDQLGHTETLYAQYYDTAGSPVGSKKGLIIHYK
jgi:hypothetical protein